MKTNDNIRVSYLCQLHLTIASIYHPKSGLLAYGTAGCGFEDQPSRKRGRAIAVGRAQLVLSEALADLAEGEPPRDNGEPVQTKTGMHKMRHAWVVRRADLDPKRLVRDLRDQFDCPEGVTRMGYDPICEWVMARNELDMQLLDLVERRLGKTESSAVSRG